MTDLVRWTNRHLGIAAVVGGFLSATAGAAWWLAKGGAAALIVSVTALSDPEVAETLVELPKYHERTEAALVRLAEGQQQVLDSLEVLRMRSEKVVEWAPQHSQRLTDAVGGCYAGEDCTIYLRGRRTPAGEACNLTGARPRLILPDGKEFPVEGRTGLRDLDLGAEFETLRMVIEVPDFIEPGVVGVVVLEIYSDCPFVSEGQDVHRDTFRLFVKINPPR